MCRRVTCRTCQRPTWAGCGAHVEQVLADVPRADRCPGHPRSTENGERRSWLDRLLGR